MSVLVQILLFIIMVIDTCQTLTILEISPQFELNLFIRHLYCQFGHTVVFVVKFLGAIIIPLIAPVWINLILLVFYTIATIHNRNCLLHISNSS